MKKPDSHMWGDAEQSDIVRELLRAGRDASDAADYDLEAGLQRHMNMVQIGAPAPDWAGEILGKAGASTGGLSAASSSVPWWGWLAASVLGVTSGAVVWSDALPSARNEAPASDVRVVEDQGPTAPAVKLPAVTLPAPSAPSVEPTDAIEVAPGPERTARRAAARSRPRREAAPVPAPRRARVQAPKAPATQPASSALSDYFAAPANAGGGQAAPSSTTATGKTSTNGEATADRHSQESTVAPAEVTAPRPDPEAQKRLSEARQRMAREAMLEREMRMLKVAQASLNHNPARSLRLAQQGEREFKDSLFTPERQYVLIAALARLGRHAEARDLASDYLKRYPSGPFSDRVRKALQD